MKNGSRLNKDYRCRKDGLRGFTVLAKRLNDWLQRQPLR